MTCKCSFECIYQAEKKSLIKVIKVLIKLLSIFLCLLVTNIYHLGNYDSIMVIIYSKRST